MTKTGLDDFLLTHTKDEFLALPQVDLDDPAFNGCAEWYDDWKEKKEKLAETPRIAAHLLDDIGNGARFAGQHGDDVKWSPDLGWRYYNGKFWADNKTREAERRAEITARNILIEAFQCKDNDRTTALTKWAHASASMSKVNAMLESAKNKVGMSVPTSVFDIDQWLLNVDNGTIELRTQTLREHRQADMITRCCAVAYDADAVAPLWDSFLLRIVPDPDTRLFLQKAAGYSLTGSINEQCFFLCYGMGKNGKSKFIEALAKQMGDYAGLMRTEALMLIKNQNNSGDIADLRGQRMVYSIEPPSNSTFNTSFIKQQTGGEELKGKFLYHDLFSFMPTHKLWIGSNHDIKIPDNDEGIRRRVMQAPFKTWIPPEERDPDLGEKLKLEWPGILNWRLEGLRLYLQDGLGMPAEVQEATQLYFDRVDPLKDFFDDQCAMDPWFKIKHSELHKKYLEWAKETGEKRPFSRKRFHEYMKNKGYETKKIDGYPYWEGIDLKG